MQFVIETTCLVFGMALCAGLFYLVPILSVSPKNLRSIIVTNQELLDISQQLFDADEKNLLSLVKFNYQGFINSSKDFDDHAPLPLLTVNETIDQHDTVKKMKALHDNFLADTSLDEDFTPEEDVEQNDFIDAVLQTPVMKLALTFLAQKGFFNWEDDTPGDLIRRLWFGFYPRNRSATITSSGFEHVFMWEIKRNAVTGMHNWIYFAEAEKRGELDYKGWLKIKDLGDKGRILKVRFTMNGYRKPVSSFMVGSSPELEMALYTVCFYARPNKGCKLIYDERPFSVLTHVFERDGIEYIGSAYVNL